MLEHVSYESHQGKKYILKSTKTGLYGLFDSNGNTILPMEYDEMNFGTKNKKQKLLLKLKGNGAYVMKMEKKLFQQNMKN